MHRLITIFLATAVFSLTAVGAIATSEASAAEAKPKPKPKPEPYLVVTLEECLISS